LNSGRTAQPEEQREQHRTQTSPDMSVTPCSLAFG
jgi:hypothetical protein